MMNGIFPEYRRARMGGAAYEDVVEALGASVADDASSGRRDLSPDEADRALAHAKTRIANPLFPPRM